MRHLCNLKPVNTMQLHAHFNIKGLGARDCERGGGGGVTGPLQWRYFCDHAVILPDAGASVRECEASMVSGCIVCVRVSVRKCALSIAVMPRLRQLRE